MDDSIEGQGQIRRRTLAPLLYSHTFNESVMVMPPETRVGNQASISAGHSFHPSLWNCRIGKSLAHVSISNRTDTPTKQFSILLADNNVDH
jgi:hypothetical protein